LGKLFKVKIRHDDSNFSSDWFLDRVEVIDPDNPEPYMFHCERWLAKKKDDRKLERNIFVKVCTNCSNFVLCLAGTAMVSSPAV
jgi:lipoxygenase homology domain-containing protein 1